MVNLQMEGFEVVLWILGVLLGSVVIIGSVLLSTAIYTKRLKIIDQQATASEDRYNSMPWHVMNGDQDVSSSQDSYSSCDTQSSDSSSCDSSSSSD